MAQDYSLTNLLKRIIFSLFHFKFDREYPFRCFDFVHLGSFYFKYLRYSRDHHSYLVAIAKLNNFFNSIKFFFLITFF